MSAWKGGIVVALLPVYCACGATPATTTTEEVDIVRDPFPEAQAAIRESLLALDDIRDRDELESVHIHGPKFSQMDIERGRTGFDEMIAEEFALVAAVRDASIDWRDLKIDVFGDVAIVTSLPRFTLTFKNGGTAQLDMVSTLVWVRTTEGWKIAHENNNAIRDIVADPFPEAQQAIREEILALEEVGRSRDWEALRAAHLEGPKFTDFGSGMERDNFDQMLETEIAALSAIDDFTADFRDLKIDVFGDVAVATSFPVYTGTSANGEKIKIERRATMVYVRTPHGWKIAHEHLSVPQAQ